MALLGDSLERTKLGHADRANGYLANVAAELLKGKNEHERMPSVKAAMDEMKLAIKDQKDLDDRYAIYEEFAKITGKK